MVIVFTRLAVLQLLLFGAIHAGSSPVAETDDRFAKL